jgi:hypothetical protein
VSGISAQENATSGPPDRRELWWIAFAISSFPVPDDSLDAAEHLAHDLRAPQHVVELVALPELLAERDVLLAQVPQLADTVEEVDDLLVVERLQDVLEGARLHRLDGRLDRAVSGDDDDLGRGVLLLRVLQELHPVHPGHLDVRDEDVESARVQLLLRGEPVRHRDHLVARGHEVVLQGDRDGSFVVREKDVHPAPPIRRF